MVPIDYAFRPRLRDRLTLRRLALRRNPWTFGGSVFHTPFRYSCQHSHFCGLQRPSRVRLHRLTERSATTQRTEDRRRTTDNLCAASPGLAGQALQHARDHLIFITPPSPDGFVDVAEIECITHPNSHLIARTSRQLQKAFEFRFRSLLTTIAFGDIRADGLACAPHLIDQHMLFNTCCSIRGNAKL